MASVKLFVTESGSVVIRLIHLRAYRHIKLGIKIDRAQFDFQLMRCKPGHKHGVLINEKLVNGLNAAEAAIIAEAETDHTPDTLVEIITKEIRNAAIGGRLRPFVERLVQEKDSAGGKGTPYTTALARFELFLDKPPMLTDLNYTTLVQFKAHLVKEGLSSNSIRAYLAAIKTWSNRALDSELISKQPFKRGLMPTKARAVKQPVEVEKFRQLYQARDKYTGQKRAAIDTIVLQFIFAGMDYADLWHLKKSDIKKGYITFKRYKLRSFADPAEITLPVIKEAKELMHGEDFIYHSGSLQTSRRNHRRALIEVSKAENLTLFRKEVRHTWATVAEGAGVKQSISMACMGHVSNDVHSMYTRDHQSEIDAAIKLVAGMVVG